MKKYESPEILVIKSEALDCFSASDGPDSPIIGFEWA